MPTKKILITGANGQLGQEFAFLAANFPHFEFTFLSRDELDITSKTDIDAFFLNKNINYCINCAAYTAVDKAENDIKSAESVNITGVKNLGEACAKLNIPFIHFSTDYVYHNNQNTPFVETDNTNPQSIYGKSKLNGEKQLLAIHPQAMIIRTSWVYSTFGHNFVKTMLRLGKERDELSVVFDQIGSPTYARDLAAVVLQILTKNEEKNLPNNTFSGIYHYSNEGLCSWYDFALAIFEIAQIKCHVLPIESKAYPTPAKRPPFSVLNKTKIKDTFEIEIPHWRESLKKCLVAQVISN